MDRRLVALRSGIRLVVAVGAIASALASLPPTRYSVSPFCTEIHCLGIGGSPGGSGVVLTVEDTSAPQFSGIQLWRQDPNGIFSPFTFATVPNAYAHLPIAL